METKLLDRLSAAVNESGLKEPSDGRGKLAVNPDGKKWKRRDPLQLKGLVWHQELGWGSVEAVAKYHTGKSSHLYDGGVESISYSLAIRKNGQIVLCNDIKKATWSQGYRGRRGDENAEFLSVMFEGMFKADGVTDPSAGEPTSQQMTAGLLLWNSCRKIWNWNDNGLYGHYHFGKPACPGDTLKAVIEATRANVKEKGYNFKTVKGRQKALIKLGYLKGKADGIWGPASRAALITFQSKTGISADGIWGPNTESAVKAAIEKKRK